MAAVGVMVLIVVVPWLGLMKVWRRTPADFLPLVRVSAVDLVQAWSLKRAAARHVAGGDVQAAVDCWRSAFANDPADLDVLRDWLGVMGRDESLAAGKDAFIQASVAWLLHLGRTNIADVELAMGVMQRAGDVRQVLSMGGRWKDQLGPAGKGWMARAHFDDGEMEGFDLAWRANETAFMADPELVLYRDAWRAHWGPVATLREGRERLAEAMDRPRDRRLALRLGMHVAYAREDPKEYGRLLGLLEAEGGADAGYHLRYWAMLIASGQKESARKRAAGGLVQPRTLVEIQAMAKVLVALDLGSRALSMLEANRERFRRDPGYWLVEARCLMALEKWKEMEVLGRACRGVPDIDKGDLGVGWGIEAIGANKDGRREEARELGRRMLLSIPKSPDICGALALMLTEAKLDYLALAMVRLLEPHAMDNPAYWKQRTLVASQTLDGFELVRSSTERMALEPNDILARNMHAAVLLMVREDPAEVIRLTFQNMALLPGNVDVRLNHAMALAFNGRAREASEILSAMSERSLTPSQRNNHRVAWFDVYVAQMNWTKAREQYEQMETSQLLPLQRKRVQEEIARMPP
ncbi:MAG: hypothetical protein WCR07_14510 [Verrucomicrobiota bacterium]|jgi:tetratricopeptide (TPR) repeat protein